MSHTLDVNNLITRAFKNRNIGEGLQWIRDNYTGSDSRKAIRFQMDAPQQDLDAANRAYWLFHDAVELGYSRDTDFTRVYR